ncbi:MAG: hypothetical protein LBG44_09715 [Gemmatimonadota bacterium]|jgi:hypothetical protein|nr:hypothetical protein [Gemmatimonadota bacterium]
MLCVLGVAGFRRYFRPKASEGSERLAAVVVQPVDQHSASTGLPQTVLDGRSPARYEILLAEGGNAVGKLVRAELYCEAIIQMTVRPVADPSPALGSAADSDGRVGVAECRWGGTGRGTEFVLVIPPDLAEPFTAIPEEQMNYVARRRVVARVEWLGRSEGLSLRTAGVLRAIEPSSPSGAPDTPDTAGLRDASAVPDTPGLPDAGTPNVPDLPGSQIPAATLARPR